MSRHFIVGNLKKIGKVDIHAIGDTYGSYPFGFLHVFGQLWQFREMMCSRFIAGRICW